MLHQGELLKKEINKRGLSYHELEGITGKTRQNFDMLYKKQTIRESTLRKYLQLLKIEQNIFFEADKQIVEPKPETPIHEAYKLLELKLAAAERENEHLREKMRLQEEIYRLTLEKLTKTP